MKIERSALMTKFPKAIFGDLKKASKEAATTGHQIIDLSLGSPDLPPDEKIRQALAHHALAETSYGYTLGGIQDFNEAVARYYKRRVEVTLDASTQVLQTMGSQEGLVHLPLAFCNPGDIVLTTDPGYVAYEAGIHLAQAEPYYMPLRADNAFLPDLQAIPEDVAQRAKLLILNLPGNPVPAMPSIRFFNDVIAFAKKYNIIVLHDAAYSEFYFDETAPVSFLQAAGAIDVGIEINSLSKSFSLAGARIAYIVGNAEIIAILQQLKSNLDYGTFEPIQRAAIVALDNAEEITARLRQTFAARHHVLSQGLAALGWDVVPSKGGMFVYAKYPQQTLNDIEFAYEAIAKIGVVVVPGSIFGMSGTNYVRIALVQPENVIREALRRFATL